MKLSVHQIIVVSLNVLALVMYFGVYRVFDKESVVKNIAFYYLVLVQMVNLVYVLIRPR